MTNVFIIIIISLVEEWNCSGLENDPNQKVEQLSTASVRVFTRQCD